MLLGKRARPPMKRTTSMSEITFDLNTPSSDSATDPNHHFTFNPHHHAPSPSPPVPQGPFATWLKHPPQPAPTGSDQIPIHPRKQFSAEAPDFLRSCSLCKRRLVPGRDIYMYRGDSGFCSQECRQKQMKQDEKKDKFFVASKKQAVVMAAVAAPLPPPPTPPSSGSQLAT